MIYPKTVTAIIYLLQSEMIYKGVRTAKALEFNIYPVGKKRAAAQAWTISTPRNATRATRARTSATSPPLSSTKTRTSSARRTRPRTTTTSARTPSSSSGRSRRRGSGADNIRDRGRQHMSLRLSGNRIGIEENFSSSFQMRGQDSHAARAARGGRALFWREVEAQIEAARGEEQKNMGNMLSSFFALSWAWLQRREKKSFRIGFGAKRGHKTGIFDPPKRLASTSSLYGAMHMSLSMIYSWEMLPLPPFRGLPSGSSDFPIWSYEYILIA